MSKLSDVQYDALGWLANAPLKYTVAGFAVELGTMLCFSSGTVLSLEKRGFCAVTGKSAKRFARITDAGRRALERRPPR